MSLEKLEEFYKKLRDFADAEIADSNLDKDKSAIRKVIQEIEKQSELSRVDFSESLKILNLELIGTKLPEKKSMLIEQLKQPYLLKEWTTQYMEALKESGKDDILLNISGDNKSRVKMVLSSLQKNTDMEVIHELEKDNILTYYVTLKSFDLIKIKDKIQEFKEIVQIDAVHFLPDFKERTLEEKQNLIKESINIYDRNTLLQAAELGHCSTNTVYHPIDIERFIEKSLQNFYNGTKELYQKGRSDKNVVYYLYVDQFNNPITAFDNIKQKKVEDSTNKTKKHTP